MLTINTKSLLLLLLVDCEGGVGVELELLEAHLGVPPLLQVGQLQVRVLVDRLICFSCSRHSHLLLEVRLHEQHELVPRNARCAHSSRPNLVRRGLENSAGVDLQSLADLEGQAVLRNADLNDRTFSGHGVQASRCVLGDSYFCLKELEKK